MSLFTIIERLAPHVEKELNLILKSEEEAQTLKSKLERIHEGLQEAERHGVTNTNVKQWLGELEDVMYEMDDALDEWETMGIEKKIEQQSVCNNNLSDPWEKVRSLFVSLYSSFKHVIGQRKLTKEMIALNGRLDKILDARGRFDFVSPDRSMYNSSQLEKLETTSSIDVSKVHGRKYDVDQLVSLLLSKGECGDAVVVSIVGIGGLGKTTVAQLVYNDHRVEEHFGRLKAWVSVPDPFDASRVAQAIVGTFDRSSSGETTLEILGQRVKAIASQQNFLLVLDNLGTVDRAKWEYLKNFLAGEAGFRILVTTGDTIAARTIGTTHWPCLNFLLDSDCATILNTIALKETSGEKHEEFREIGFEIAKKCNGLPLAAKTIGHALESRSTTKGWREILGSPLWTHEDVMSDMFLPIRLSYMDLSPLLKCCFLSGVVFSKGFRFNSEGLIRIWTAQGYIDSNSAWDQVLSKGDKYLKNLSERSFFQVSGSNYEGNPTYKMHDIMHDFARYLSVSKSYVIVDGRTDKRPYSIPNGGRILYFCARFISQKDLPRNIYSLLKRARLLCLSDCDLEEFSEDLGKLIHLRYLDLSGNLMKELPNTVSDLYNLQTLDLRRCRYLSRLPRGLKKLIKLRHLLISDTESLLEFHEELSKLSGLWTLDKCTATRDSILMDYALPNKFYEMDGDSESPNAKMAYENTRYHTRSDVSCTTVCLPLFTVFRKSIREECHLQEGSTTSLLMAQEGELEQPTEFPVLSPNAFASTKIIEACAPSSEWDDSSIACTPVAVGSAAKSSDYSDQLTSLSQLAESSAVTNGGLDKAADIEWSQQGIEIIASADMLNLDSNDEAAELVETTSLLLPQRRNRYRRTHFVGEINVHPPSPSPSPSRMIASKYLKNMRTLDINGSEYSYLPQLGKLPMLVTLRIQKMDFKAVTLEFLGFPNATSAAVAGFPKLETLTFSECEFWEEWEDVEEATTESNSAAIMPCLNYLAITLCPNLKALPHRLLRAATSLQQLFIAGCPPLASAYDKELGADWDRISHIPNTIILASY